MHGSESWLQVNVVFFGLYRAQMAVSFGSGVILAGTEGLAEAISYGKSMCARTLGGVVSTCGELEWIVRRTTAAARAACCSLGLHVPLVDR